MKKNTFLAVAVTLLLLAGGLYYFLRQEAPPTPPEVKAVGTEPAARVQFSGTSIVEELQGKRLWELAAAKIEIDPSSKQVYFQEIKGVFYQDKGGKVDLTASTAVMDPETRDLVLNGDVKAVASDGAMFTAPQARWAGKERRFYGSGGIVLNREDTVLTGDTIETDANMDKVKVQGHAHVLKGVGR